MHIRGFTVCPSCCEITQGEIKTGISEILELGMPTALYQSPQVVLNEVESGNFHRSRVTVPNLILSKDSSREDKIAK